MLLVRLSSGIRSESFLPMIQFHGRRSCPTVHAIHSFPVQPHCRASIQRIAQLRIKSLTVKHPSTAVIDQLDSQTELDP